MNNFDRIRLSRAEWAAASLLAVYLLTSFLLLRLDSASANWLVSEDAGFEVLGALGLLLGAGFVFMALVRMRARGAATQAGCCSSATSAWRCCCSWPLERRSAGGSA